MSRHSLGQNSGSSPYHSNRVTLEKQRTSNPKCGGCELIASLCDPTGTTRRDAQVSIFVNADDGMSTSRTLNEGVKTGPCSPPALDDMKLHTSPRMSQTISRSHG